MEKQKSESIISEIELAETAIKRCCKRVEVLEKKLVSKYVSLEDRAKLELELEDMRKTLEKNKLDLQKFQKENSKSFAIAAIILFVSFLLYGFYLFVSE